MKSCLCSAEAPITRVTVLLKFVARPIRVALWGLAAALE